MKIRKFCVPYAHKRTHWPSHGLFPWQRMCALDSRIHLSAKTLAQPVWWTPAISSVYSYSRAARFKKCTEIWVTKAGPAASLRVNGLHCNCNIKQCWWCEDVAGHLEQERINRCCWTPGAGADREMLLDTWSRSGSTDVAGHLEQERINRCCFKTSGWPILRWRSWLAVLLWF
jgi:hypothetical protein